MRLKLFFLIFKFFFAIAQDKTSLEPRSEIDESLILLRSWRDFSSVALGVLLENNTPVEV